MMPKVEMKRQITYFDEISGSTLTGGSCTPLTSVVQGTALNQRIGNKITVKGIHVRGLFYNNASVTNLIRIMIVGSKINTTTVFQDMLLYGDLNTAGGVGTPNGTGGANQMYFPINKRAYTPYYDKLFKLGPTSQVEGTLLFKKFIKMNKTINFVSNNTGDLYQDQISLVIAIAQADDDTSTGLVVEQSFNASLFYTDA